MVSADDCLKKYGDPNSKEAQAHLVVWLIPDDIREGIPCLPVKIYLNKDMQPNLEKALRTIAEKGLGAVLHSFDGCYNVRQSKGGKSWSLHSWAIAIDMDAATNAYNATPKLDARIVAIFKANGFDWGGDWKTKDGMHFQLSKI